MQQTTNAERGRLLPAHLEKQKLLSALQWARQDVTDKITRWKKLPEWQANRSDALAQVIDLGRFIAWVCAPLARQLDREIAAEFERLANDCQDIVRPWVPAERLVEFKDHSTNALILDLLYELQADVREVKRRLPERRPKADKVVTLDIARGADVVRKAGVL